ncbi:MAG: Vms1/Ankzf1 family peptidyl-tRNA hydrolase [Vicinamibacterales bacterium]
MPKTTIATSTALRDQLDRLAGFAPTAWPVLSLYLDMRPDQNGRRNYDAFLRKALPEHSRALRADARKSFYRDARHIRQYLETAVPASTRGLALFACAAADNFFEAIQLDASFDMHELFVDAVPHLYPLARLNDQHPLYAALLADTNSARLFVFRLGRRDVHERVTNVKTRRSAIGGWSQARYRRHCENFHLHHMKEVVAVLDRVVRAEAIGQIVIAADDAARPFLMAQLPKHLLDKVACVLHLDINSPEHIVLAETLEALRLRDADIDAERVRAMVGAHAAGGLAVVGPEATLDALAKGQVEELLIGTQPDRIKLAGQLVARAQQNAARVRFVEDPALLKNVGGVGAILRFRI